jgi:hypothetical protein
MKQQYPNMEIRNNQVVPRDVSVTCGQEYSVLLGDLFLPGVSEATWSFGD